MFNGGEKLANFCKTCVCAFSKIILGIYKKKSPDADGITADILQIMGEKGVEIIYKICQLV